MLMTSGMSQSNINRLLKLPVVHPNAFLAHCIHANPLHKMHNQTHTSFKDKWRLLQKIDAIPSSGPPFHCEIVTAHGDQLDTNRNPMTKEMELFYHDPVECGQELLGNPAFVDEFRYAPEKIFEDELHSKWIYNEMWMGDWWWDMQVSCKTAVNSLRGALIWDLRGKCHQVQPLHL